MSESFLKDLLIETLQSADLDSASSQARKELQDAVITLKDDSIYISNDEKGMAEIEGFFAFMHSRFPELQFRPIQSSALKKSR